MRRVNLESYTIQLRDRDSGEQVEAPYDVKTSLINVLFHPDLELQATELLERDKLAHKILDCSNGFVLLEDAEYGKLEDSLEVCKGLTRNDVEFVKRIREAEQVEVEEKKK